VVRSLSSDDPRLVPDPALDPEAYDRICQADPGAPNCRTTLNWPAPQNIIETTRGMHRVYWDLRYEPLGEEPRAGSRTGAVPGHTYPDPGTPWAPPGEYTVRLTVNGTTQTQPLSLKLDPRVTTPAADLERVAVLAREMYDGAVAANAAYEEARAMITRLAAEGTSQAAALRAEVEALAPEPDDNPFRRFFGEPAGPPTLDGTSRTLMRAAMSMQEAEVAPTERQVRACADARAQLEVAMRRWAELRQRGE
jgi:hypothetical protein